MSPSSKKQTPIRFSPQIRARLDAEVARTGLSINAIVNIALDRYLPTPPSQEADAAPQEPASADDDLADFD